MDWNKNSIGENAGIVWHILDNNEMSWKELLERTGLFPLELAGAIGWLAREGKINIHTNGDVARFSAYHENYF